MRKRRSSLEEWRERSLDATADHIEALYRLSSPYRRSAQGNAAVSNDGRARGASSSPGYSGEPEAGLAYWEQLTRWSLVYATLPLRVLQSLYQAPDRPRRSGRPPSVVVSAAEISVQLTQGMQSKLVPFRVTNRGPRRYIDFDLCRFSASDGSLEKGVAVSLSAAPGKRSSLYSDWEKRIASIEFSAGEDQEIVLEISAKAEPTLPRSVCGALRMRPEREEPIYLPIQLKLG
jgi:hypothetical protein